MLERQYVRNTITAEDYEPECEKLIAQYKTLRGSLADSVPDVEEFMANYMRCPLAAYRLIYSGMPATVEHGMRRTHKSNSAFSIAATVQHFISAMDAIKLGMMAADQLYPILYDLMQDLNRVAQLPPDMPGKVKVGGWISKIHQMHASKELNEADGRQLLFDLEAAYAEFMSTIQEAS